MRGYRRFFMLSQLCFTTIVLALLKAPNEAYVCVAGFGVAAFGAYAAYAAWKKGDTHAD